MMVACKKNNGWQFDLFCKAKLNTKARIYKRRFIPQLADTEPGVAGQGGERRRKKTRKPAPEPIRDRRLHRD
jgi:hypothetical protein